MGTESVAKPFRAGQAFKPSARWLNGVNALLGGPKGDRGVGVLRDTPVEISVVNGTGADLPAFSVVLLVDPAVEYDAAEPHLFQFSNAFNADTPAGAGPYAITQEPIADEATGKAVVLGVTTATLHLNDTADQWAEVGSAVDDLESGTSGSALILWRDPAAVATDTGVAAKVLLLGQAAGSSSSGGGTSDRIGPSVYVGRLTSTVTSVTVGGNQEAHSANVLTLPDVGWYQITLNLRFRFNVGYPGQVGVWVQEETYGGGPAAGSGQFEGPGEDNAGNAPFSPVANAAYWEAHVPGAGPSNNGNTYQFTTVIETTVVNVRLGIRTLTSGAAGAHSIVGHATHHFYTSLTAVLLHDHDPTP